MNFRDRAVQLVTEHGYRDLCEVGVWRGELARLLYPLARTLVLVDPWSALWNDFEHDGQRYDCTMGGPVQCQGSLNEMHDSLIADLPGALVLRMPSVEAARHVPPRSLDFVFLDAVHTYEHCLDDLRAWLPKLRPGGMMAGDDYVPAHQAVARAVDALFGEKPRENVWWERV